MTATTQGDMPGTFCLELFGGESISVMRKAMKFLARSHDGCRPANAWALRSAAACRALGG